MIRVYEMITIIQENKIIILITKFMKLIECIAKRRNS